MAEDLGFQRLVVRWNARRNIPGAGWLAVPRRWPFFNFEVVWI